MPLNDGDIPRLLQRFPELNQSRTFDVLMRRLVEDNPDSYAASVNLEVLQKARAAAIAQSKRRVQTEFFDDPDISENLKSRLTVGQFGELASIEGKDLTQVMREAAEEDFLANFQPELFGSRTLGNVAAGLQTGSSIIENIPGMSQLVEFVHGGRDDRDRLVQQANAVITEQSGFFSAAGIAATAAELAAFLTLARIGAGGIAALAGGVGGGGVAALGAEGLLAQTGGFFLSGALTSPGTAGERAIAGLGAGVGVPAAATFVRVASHITGPVSRLALRTLGKSGSPSGVAFGRFVGERLTPGIINTMAANTAFTVAGQMSSLALGHEFEFFKNYLHGMVVLGTMNAAHAGGRQVRRAGKTPLERRRDPFVQREVGLRRLTERIREQQVVDDVNIDFATKTLRTEGFDPIDVQLARVYAEQGRLPSRREAALLTQKREIAQRVAAAENNILLMERGDFRKWLEDNFEKIRNTQDPVGTDLEVVDPVRLLRERPGTATVTQPELLGAGPNKTARLKQLIAERARVRRALDRALQAQRDVVEEALEGRPGRVADLVEELRKLQEVKDRLDAQGLEPRALSGGFTELENQLNFVRSQINSAREVEGAARRLPEAMEYGRIAGGLARRLEVINGELSLTIQDALFPRADPFFRLSFTVTHPGSPGNFALRIEGMKLTRKGKRTLNTLREATGLEPSKGRLTDKDYGLLASFMEQFQPTRFRRFSREIKRLEKALRSDRPEDRAGPAPEAEGQFPRGKTMSKAEIRQRLFLLKAGRRGRTGAQQERTDLENTWEWIKRLHKWEQEGRKGPMPPFKGSKDVDPVQLARTLLVESRPARENALDAIANVVPKNSKASEMLNSKDPAEVKTAEDILAQTKTLIPPDDPGGRSHRPLQGSAERPGAIPDIESHLKEVEGIAKEIQSKTDGTEPGGYTTATGSAGILGFTKPNWFDSTGRQRHLAIRKLILGQAGMDFQDLSLAAQVTFSRLNLSAQRYVEAHGKEYFRYLEELPKPQRDQAIHRFMDLREGRIETAPESLHPAEGKFLLAFDRLMKAYENALELRGFRVIKDGTYFSRIAKHLTEKDAFAALMEPRDLARLRPITSRFLKPRTNADFDHVRDAFDVLRIYLPAVNRVVAFRPFTRAMADFIAKVGVRPDIKGASGPQEVKLGLKDTFTAPTKADGIPYQTVRYIETWTRSMQGMQGKFSEHIERVADAIIRRTTGVPQGGREFFAIGAMMTNMAAIGGPLLAGKAIRNIVGGSILAIADPSIGPVNLVRGYSKLFVMDTATGRRVLNPRLREIGIFEQEFTSFLRNEARLGFQRVKGKVPDTFNTMARGTAEMWMALFQFSETLVRGAAALGAYEAAIAGGATKAQAIRIARSAAARTQTNYDAVTGAQAFSGVAGKAGLQFQRFGLNWADQFWAHIQRSGLMGARQKGIAEQKLPSIEGQLGKAPKSRFSFKAGPVDLNLVNLAGFIGAMALSNAFFREAGIAMPDLEGPLAPAPEIVKEPIQAVIDRGTAFASGEGVEGLLHGPRTPQSLEKARDFAQVLGVKTRSKGFWEAAADSLGPIAPVLSSPLTFFIDTDPGRTEADLGREFQDLRLFSEGGIQIQNIVRYIRETHRGYVASRLTGQRIFPEEEEGEIRSIEAFLRLISFRPVALDEELKRLDRTSETRALWQGKVRDANDLARDLLVEGEPAAEVFGAWMGTMTALEEEFGNYLPLSNLKSRWKAILRGADELTGKTLRQRLEEEVPFSTPSR